MTDEKDLRITRMACHKVAVEALGAIPTTSKGDFGAAAETWKKNFVALADFLVEDVRLAGLTAVAKAEKAATVSPSSENGQPEFSLEEALGLETRIKERVGPDNPSLQNAIKLKLVALGVRNPKSLLDGLVKLTKAQAEELEQFVNNEVS